MSTKEGLHMTSAFFGMIIWRRITGVLSTGYGRVTEPKGDYFSSRNLQMVP